MTLTAYVGQFDRAFPAARHRTGRSCGFSGANRYCHGVCRGSLVLPPAIRRTTRGVARIRTRPPPAGKANGRSAAAGAAAQVEPHSCSNTLAHVKRLYKSNPPLARRMLDNFCEYLRAALPQMRNASATLGTELELVRAYLDVQKIRMGERLVVESRYARPIASGRFRR